MRLQYDLKEPDFTVGNIDIVNVSRPKNYKHSYRNGRTKHGFIYTVNGAMRDDFLTGEPQSITAKESELVFIPKGTAYYGTYLEDDTEIKIVQFDLEKGRLPEYLSHPVKLSVPGAGELIEAFFSRYDGNSAGHPFFFLSCLYDLLWRIDGSYNKIPSKFKKLTPALHRMATSPEQAEPIALYADICGISEVTFRRLFREYTGRSPIEYRNDVRLDKARSLLQSGEYNVSEAAELCGFSNLSFFIRLYKKKYGHTPKKE